MSMKPKGKRPAKLERSVLITIGAAVVLLAVLCIVSDTWGAAVNPRYKLDGDLQAVRFVTHVQNGSDFVPVDSSTVTVFPKDTTLTLDDTANWIVYVGALWTGESDTVWDSEYLPLKDWQASFDDVLASIDSTNFWLGYCPTCRTRKGRGGDIDTLHIMKGTGAEPDSLLHVLYWHIGGVTGNTPDSVTIR